MLAFLFSLSSSKKTALNRVNRLDALFYQREDVVQISKDLLGKVLVSSIKNVKTAGVIVETEAYRGPDDKACHAYNNRYTDRTKVMYENGGLTYVYLCYGIHHLFNVVTAKKGMAHAVLIRAIEPLEEIETMLERRKLDQLKPQLTAGPGVMTKAMGITTANTGIDMTHPSAKIWIEDHKLVIHPKNIIASPRVGIAYAEECADWKWRFRIKGNKWTSKAK